MPSEPPCWSTESDEMPGESSDGATTNTARDQGQPKKDCGTSREVIDVVLIRKVTTTEHAGVRRKTREEDPTADQSTRVSIPECSKKK